MNNTKAKMNSSKISVAKKTENGSVVKKMKAVEKMKNQKEKERSGNSDRSLSLCLLLTLLFTGGQRNFQVSRNFSGVISLLIKPGAHLRSPACICDTSCSVKTVRDSTILPSSQLQTTARTEKEIFSVSLTSNISRFSLKDRRGSKARILSAICLSKKANPPPVITVFQ